MRRLLPRRSARASARRYPRRQRFIVVAAFLALIMAVTLVPSSSPADAGLPSRAQCGPNDAYRNTLQLYGGAGTITPCISKANLKITASGGSNSSPAFRVNKIRIVGTDTIKYADGTTESLKHVTFESFVINKNSTLTVQPPSGGPSYTTKLTPDSAAQVGGEGINTDLWVTGGSSVTVVFLFCISASVNTFDTLSWLLNGSSWNGCALDMDVRFLAVYKPSGTTTGSFPVRLPNTTVDVTPK